VWKKLQWYQSLDLEACYPSLGSSFSHNKMADERTFIAIKPDGVQRGLVRIILVLLMQPHGSARKRL
jgi:hypothetical protein